MVLPKVENYITVHGKKVSLAALLDVDDTDLSSEYASQAARFAYFGVLEVEAEDQYLRAKATREEDEADAFLLYKNDPKEIPEGSKGVTDTLANRLVALDDIVMRAKRTEAGLRREWKMLQTIVKAFASRADMLQSIGAHLRHEADMDGLSVRDSVEKTGRRARRAMEK